MYICTLTHLYTSVVTRIKLTMGTLPGHQPWLFGSLGRACWVNVQVLLVLLSTSFVRVCLQGHRAVGFPNHGVARIARYSHRAVVCCSQSPQQDYQNTLGGIQGRHHWQRPGKMNSERLAWLNWAALATTEPNLLWAGYFFVWVFTAGSFPIPRDLFFVWVFTAGSFPIPFPIPRDLFLYRFLQRDLFRSCFKHIIFILLQVGSFSSRRPATMPCQAIHPR